MADAYDTLASMSQEAVYGVSSYIQYQVEEAQGNGGSYEENSPCSASGNIKTITTFDAASSTANIEIAYQDCEQTDSYYNNYHSRLNGVLRFVVRSFTGSYPTAYDYYYEDYRYENLMTGGGRLYNIAISVDPDTDGIKAVLSATLTDLTTQETVKTTDYTTHFPLFGYYYDLPTAETGHIEHSLWGTLTISRDGSYTYLTGANGSKLRLDRPMYMYQLHAALDADGDDVYESFALLPWDAFDAESATNTAPVIAVSNPGQAGTNQTVVVPINGVSDAESDFLSYSVAKIQSPDNVDIHLELLEDQSFSFRTTGSGDYVIALTVDDGRGGVTTQNITVHASLPQPIAPAISSIDLSNGATGSVSVQPSNPEAGPFTYQIISGPSGVTVDSQGTVQWASSLPFFPRGQTQAQIKVSNADHSITVPVRFNVSDSQRSDPIVRSLPAGPNVNRNVFVLDFNNDGGTRVLLTDNKDMIYTLKFENGTYVQDWVYPYPIGTSSIKDIAPLDLDHDGNYEIAVFTTDTIYIINEAHSAIDRSVVLSGFASSKGLIAADIDNDGKDELITLGINYSTMNGIVLDATTLAEKWRTPALPLGQDFAVGNVDNDPQLEIVFAGGYVYDGITHANEWAYTSAFGNDVHVGDIDGDGIDEIVGTSFSEPGDPSVYNAVDKTLSWSIAGAHACGVGLVQLDGDAAKEILTSSDCYWATALTAYDATASGATQKWIAATGISGRNFVAGDLNSDGNVDIFMLADNYFTTSAPAVFDTFTSSIVFDSTGTAVSSGFGGGLKATLNGTQQILFSAFNNNYPTSQRFLAVEPTSGTLASSPLLPTTLSGQPSFCVSDFDGDGNDDIQFGAVESYSTSFLASYDFVGQLEQWRKSYPYYYSAPTSVTCRDFNNDGHVDVGASIAGTVDLHDAFNQTLLWSAPFTSNSRIASADFDGDGTPEIITGTVSQIEKYKASGNTYVQSGVYTGLAADAWWYWGNPVFSIVDIDGDQTPEIVVAAQTYDGSGVKSKIVVLNSDLSERSRTTINGLIPTIAPEFVKSGHVLVALSDGTSANHRIALVDVASGNWVWQSPQIIGGISSDSLHYDSNGGGRLVFGTSQAMYITR